MTSVPPWAAAGSRKPALPAAGPLLALLALAALALGFVVYLLWPRWPEAPIPLDAPSVPIVIAGERFNIPPRAIRAAVQRHPGPQERVDLVYLWPSLAPPDSGPGDKPRPDRAANGTDRLFVTIAAREAEALAPLERFKIIYPRYSEQHPAEGPAGLAVVAFRDATPYQGEDLVYDPAAPQRFAARCSRSANPLTPATCLYERVAGAAAVTVRFPRAWLGDWRALLAGIDGLFKRWRPAG